MVETKTLEYYFKDKLHVIFSKYTCDTLGIIKHKESGQMPSYGNGAYNVCVLTDDNGKRRTIRVARAVASTFLGKPPTPLHTVDHKKSKQKKNDALSNIRWLCKKGQRDNQNRPETHISSFIVVKDGIEKTVNEWVECMNATKLPKECEFTKSKIEHYARRKQRGFAYKEYPKLEGEKWLEIEGSRTKRGDYWEISNMNRVKWNTNHAENVLSGKRLRRSNGYPIIGINGKQWLCHILAFAAFHPKLWKAKKPEEMVLHEDDDREDFRPHKLRLGTASDNGKGSHANGKYDDTKSARMKCASYINGILEKDDHPSLADAAKYLNSNGYPKATEGHISKALSGDRKSAYGRTWQKIE
ncbi:hypothetical protein PBCVCVR1_651R [Paramecium bursaria Chlorella virus CVR-1]|uniref:Uncharacterized protein n=1 Tax=Paramecium bursaria Chlorella virus CVA-1 TaxID=42683 RepID=M1HW46_9PHYC|nr:hypothetical protein F8205_gp255 [Paramecium bursaria Chlorella virus CVA-1]AGE50570.1 hypothetical protein PBCVCVA1_642R [Paramecium bursaria Chlorella virus CVA-1]AGE52249.1 hypothetical protein PBCVCVR1_651R [Paramecium bursaria Chlorella virus CVR-1]